MSVRILALAAVLCAAPSAACTSSTPPEAAPKIGAEAPDLTQTAHNGEVIELRKLGRPAIVYFYPKDETPGCTAEACAFRDAWDRYDAEGVAVIGVSADSNESHREFAEEHELPFPLIADEELQWAHAFGVETTMGMTHRVSFLLDRDGRIAKVYPKVDPGVHAEEILDDVAALKAR
jgi:peroxiredoxin Q/BCP